MPDAIVEDFNDAGTWDEILAAIESNAAGLLDDLYTWKLSLLETDVDRMQALGLGINEIKTLFGDFEFVSEIKAIVKRQVDIEFAKYEFVSTFKALGSAEDVRSALELVELLHNDRHEIIQAWSSSGDPIVRARAAALETEPYTIVLREVASHLGDGVYLDALAAMMMSAHQEHGPFDSLDVLIQALGDANDALVFEQVVTSFNEAADWQAMLAAIKLNASTLLDSDHLAKLEQLSIEGAHEQMVGLGLTEIRTLFGNFTSLEMITAAVEMQITIVHGRYAAIGAINSAQDAGSLATALSIHAARLYQHRQELIAEWLGSGDPDVVARANELEDELYTTVLREVSSHFGNEAYRAEFTARMWSALQNGSFLSVDALIATFDMVDKAIDATHDAVISGTSSGTISGRP